MKRGRVVFAGLAVTLLVGAALLALSACSSGGVDGPAMLYFYLDT